MCEVTRSLFDTIRQFRESFDVYASKLSFEWEQIAGEGPVLHSNLKDAERISIPEYSHLLPPSVRAYSTGKVADEGHASSVQGGGHGGSYPHMVHEFLCAIRENRNSAIDADKAANWTMAGICAHESALRGGEGAGAGDLAVSARTHSGSEPCYGAPLPRRNAASACRSARALKTQRIHPLLTLQT